MRRMMKRTISAGLAAMLAMSSLTGCGGGKTETKAEAKTETKAEAAASGETKAESADPYADLEPVTWKFTHSQSAEHFQQAALEEFAEYMKEKSGGKFTIEIYHSGTLGTEQEVIESMQTGSIAGTVAAASLLANFVPCYNLFALPALFKDVDQFKSVMTDEEFNGKLTAACADASLINYGYYQNFFREIYTKTPIEKVEDFKAQKIRLMASDIMLDTFQALNCNATTTAWTELYSALQLGVCDGLDHVASSVRAMAFYENLKYVCEPNLFVTPMFVIVSQPMYDKLPDAYKALVDDGINNVLVPKMQELADDAHDTDLNWLLTEGGLTMTECDVEGIQAAVAGVRDKYIEKQEDWVKELAKQILAQ